MCSVRPLSFRRWLFHVSKLGNPNTLVSRHGSQKRQFSTTGVCRTVMPAWVIDKYGSNDVLRFTKNAGFPIIDYPNEVIVKVVAAGLNPLDVSMRGEWRTRVLVMNSILKSTLHINLTGIHSYLVQRPQKIKKNWAKVTHSHGLWLCKWSSLSSDWLLYFCVMIFRYSTDQTSFLLTGNIIFTVIDL